MIDDGNGYLNCYFSAQIQATSMCGESLGIGPRYFVKNIF
jgi:hypothetical protein